MLHDLACLALGIGVYLMWAEFKKFRAVKCRAKNKTSPSIEFGANLNPVEVRMLFDKDKVLEILAEYAAARRSVQPGNYSYHGLLIFNQKDGLLNVRIEIKKSNHHDL